MDSARRLERFLSIHEQISQLCPDIQVEMSYSMPTCRPGDGRVARASQKSCISLYNCGQSHLEKYRLKQPEQKTGKGCITQGT